MLVVGDMLINEDGIYVAVYNVNFNDRRYSLVKLNYPRGHNRTEVITFPDMEEALKLGRINRLDMKHNKILELLYAKQSD